MVGSLSFKDTPTKLRDSGPAPFLTFSIRLRFVFEKYNTKNYSVRIFYHYVNLCFLRKNAIVIKIISKHFLLNNSKYLINILSSWVDRIYPFVSPLNPNISIHILYTFLYTHLLILTRRICSTIKASCGSDHFLCSHDLSEWFSSIIARRN